MILIYLWKTVSIHRIISYLANHLYGILMFDLITNFRLNYQIFLMTEMQ
jgi:hypothetical protein